MIIYTAMNKRETRRMQLLGTPMLLVVLGCCMRLSTLWSILFVFVALIPYSYFYSMAYMLITARRGSQPGWQFYGGVLLVQFVVIAGLVTYAWTARG